MRKKVTEAYLKSKRSLEEVLDFMKGKADILAKTGNES